ncbi:TPA: hypothetical protein RQN69_000261 [Klebsiella michiganensis]|nr:hypothetical protein [Klebsiella michiganensis]
MTTDITELAQREKFEAWAEEVGALPWGYLKNRRTNTGYFSKHDYTSLWAAWKAAGAELVEALEKAQQRITQLESRTVTVSKSDIFNVPGGETYVGGEMISVDTLCLYLAEHGIKWEAE